MLVGTFGVSMVLVTWNFPFGWEKQKPEITVDDLEKLLEGSDITITRDVVPEPGEQEQLVNEIVRDVFSKHSSDEKKEKRKKKKKGSQAGSSYISSVNSSAI